jgi:hypothetical protein
MDEMPNDEDCDGLERCGNPFTINGIHERSYIMALYKLQGESPT